MAISNTVECPQCGKMAVREVSEPYSFMYGTENPIELTASLPVLACEECGFRFTDGRAENIEHDTICRHLGRLTSQEIRDLRKRRGLSRSDLVQLGGFGEASVKRWETGALVQNASADRFLRLIDDEEVLEKLRRLSSKYIEQIPLDA